MRDKQRSTLIAASVDMITDMIIWLDRSGNYIFVNKAATDLLGYSEAEFLRMNMLDVDPTFNQEIWQEHWREVESRKSFKIETVNRTRSGVSIPVEVTTNLVEVGGQQFNCSIVRDITERKHAETVLQSLNAEIYKLSITDGLTGIANRRYFDITLQAEMDRHARSGEPVSIILIDIDAFKDFNDRYGHVKGDDCLRQVAAALEREIRTTGVAARYGGEEFACILPAAGQLDALAVAEAIQSAIATLAIPHDRSAVAPHVTVSMGVLTLPPHQSCAQDEILQAADSLLYRAKGDGRNRFVYGIWRAPAVVNDSKPPGHETIDPAIPLIDTAPRPAVT